MSLAVGTAFQFFFVPTQGITGALGGPEDRARNYSLLAVGFSIASFLGPLIAGFSIDYLGYQLGLPRARGVPRCRGAAAMVQGRPAAEGRGRSGRRAEEIQFVRPPSDRRTSAMPSSQAG